MRIRRLPLVAMLALGAVALLATPASAQEGEDPGAKFQDHLEHCLEEALQSKEEDPSFNLTTAVDNCHEAPSIVTPAVAELVWGAIAWAIVAFVLLKFAFPALRKTLRERSEKIRTDLEDADTAKTQAEAELAEYRAQLANSRNEGAQLVEAARADAERVRIDIIARAEADAAEIKARATDDIRLATERAQADLQASVKDLSIELAEKVVERNLDPDTQRALIDSYIAQVGSN
jgi:F-type H+-transporting ATPase subunit b